MLFRELFNFYSRTYFLPEDVQFLAQGLIFGEDSRLSRSMKELFQGLGLSHFTAASGANLLLLVPPKVKAISWLRWAVLERFLEFVGVILYLKIAFLSPSLWRAAIFWILGFFGRLVGIKVSLFTRCLATLSCVFFFSPNYFGLLGFQLSFLCMVALGFSQAFKTHENSLQELLKLSYFIGIRESFRESLWIFIFLSPLLFLRFGSVVPMGAVGTVMASYILQLFAQASLWSLVLRELPFLVFLQKVTYWLSSVVFFLLWFVDASVLRVLVWLFVFVSVCRLVLRIRKERRLWLEIP